MRIMALQRVLIIGAAGSGKSILASELGNLLGLQVFHLDSLYWKEGWERPTREEWLKTVQELTRKDSWILDGNYGGTLETRLAAADSVIFLAFPRLLCLIRVLKRAIQYWGRTRPDLGPGCKEHLPDWEFLNWIWTYPKVRTPGILEMLRETQGDKSIYVLKSPSELGRFLKQLRTNSPRKDSLASPPIRTGS